nr:hypothetical protein [uncultured Desulfobacter sp.]
MVSDDLLGTEKWVVGPSGVILRQQGYWTYGILDQHVWDYAGDDDRSSVQRHCKSGAKEQKASSNDLSGHFAAGKKDRHVGIISPGRDMYSCNRLDTQLAQLRHEHSFCTSDNGSEWS